MKQTAPAKSSMRYLGTGVARGTNGRVSRGRAAREAAQAGDARYGANVIEEAAQKEQHRLADASHFQKSTDARVVLRLRHPDRRHLHVRRHCSLRARH